MHFQDFYDNESLLMNFLSDGCITSFASEQYKATRSQPAVSPGRQRMNDGALCAAKARLNNQLLPSPFVCYLSRFVYYLLVVQYRQSPEP